MFGRACRSTCCNSHRARRPSTSVTSEPYDRQPSQNSRTDPDAVTPANAHPPIKINQVHERTKHRKKTGNLKVSANRITPQAIRFRPILIRTYVRAARQHMVRISPARNICPTPIFRVRGGGRTYVWKVGAQLAKAPTINKIGLGPPPLSKPSFSPPSQAQGSRGPPLFHQLNIAESQWPPAILAAGHGWG